MWWIELAVALTIALIFVSILVGLLSWSLPGRHSGLWSLMLLFLLFFLFVWGVGSWIQPVGPQLWGTNFLPFVFAGFFLALLLAALAPPRRRPGSAPASSDAPEISEDAGVAAFGALLWVLLIGLVGVIIAGYVMFEDEIDDISAGMVGPDETEVEEEALPYPSMDDDLITERAEDELLDQP